MNGDTTYSVVEVLEALDRKARRDGKRDDRLSCSLIVQKAVLLCI